MLEFLHVGNALALCDLPGFGLREDARTMKRGKIASMMHDYIHDAAI